MVDTDKKSEALIEARKQDFLLQYAKNGSVVLACEGAGITTQQLDNWLLNDSTFITEFNSATQRVEEYIDALGLSGSLAGSTFQVLKDAHRSRKAYRLKTLVLSGVVGECT